MRQLFFGPDGSSLSQPTDVIRFLGKQEQHWQKDRSAYQAAHSWFAAEGLPPNIQKILETDTALAGATLQKAIFENKTKLDEYGRESQTDILAILHIGNGLAVLGVEAKVDESFGPLVDEWNDYSPGKLRRLAGLLERLALKSRTIGSLRYQLLHRTAAAIIEAERIDSHEAVMIIQSFDKNRAGFDDFAAFADVFGTPTKTPGILSNSKVLNGINIRLGWTENQMQFFDERPI